MCRDTPRTAGTEPDADPETTVKRTRTDVLSHRRATRATQQSTPPSTVDRRSGGLADSRVEDSLPCLDSHEDSGQCSGARVAGVGRATPRKQGPTPTVRYLGKEHIS